MATPFPICLEGKATSIPGALQHILQVGTEYAFCTIQISAVNDSLLNNAKIRVAISTASTPDAVSRLDFIEVADELSPGGRYTNFGVLVPSNNNVYVSASTSDVIFRVTGLAHVAV